MIFKLILVIGGWGISDKIALRWMSLDLADDKSTMVQAMAWCTSVDQDLRCHLASLDLNELTTTMLDYFEKIWICIYISYEGHELVLYIVLELVLYIVLSTAIWYK